tara:strand:- start:2116 stop:3768 length:1653 start_codon:yes stop_codon:yes gene_type:complete
MSGILQLSEQLNPSAQTFVVDEPIGSVLTGIGLFFAKAPEGASSQPISIELRPCAESGAPSAKKFIQGTKVTVPASTIAASANTVFQSATEVRFSFREPVYVPGNTLLALVVSTGAAAEEYQIWVGKNGKRLTNSTTEFFSSVIEKGAFYESSNGTAWEPDNEKDLAFKVYRAKFQYANAFAVFNADVPPPKRLTEQTFIDDNTKYPSDPFLFTAGSSTVNVVHAAHGFQVGDRVTLSKGSNGFDSADTINGVAGSSLYGVHTLTATDPYGYSFNCGTNATASVRGGGTGVIATEQYVIDEFQAILPAATPPLTNMSVLGDFLTSKSFGGNETPYAKIADVRIDRNEVQVFKNPAVLAATTSEADHNSGNASLKLTTIFELQHLYTAPYINEHAASIRSASNFIDYQDSSSTINRNLISTVPFTLETEPNSGTTAAKHLTIVYNLELPATSIRTIVDAIRPQFTDFSVWYRTNSDDSLIEDNNWVEFSKLKNPPDTSNYSDLPQDFEIRTYEFNKYDLPQFNKYQIKITMNSTKSSNTPLFQNLRTIATI